ncbi:hypothetical protein C8J57DRAFT_1721642 [Mycena rebaudengoi]|nr:hypothetical protein C8J57DRAFT_1721642 [Mycena rebaudengoi]
MPSLPQELVDSIVSGVDDYSSLKSCSLVSTSFVAPAQRIIFKSLRLVAGGKHPKIDVVGDSLAASPHLATYIRHLTVILSNPDSEHEVHAMESILLAVRNIERLKIDGRSMQWESIAPNLRAALQMIIALPSLHALSMVAVFGLPSTIIYSAASSVSTLGFHRVAVNRSDGPQQPPSVALDVQLTHLMLVGTGEAVHDLCDVFLAAPAQVARLERLSIDLDRRSHPYMDQFFTAIAPSLRHLSLDIHMHSHEPISPPHLPLVRALDLQVSINARRSLPQNFLITFSNFAAAFPGIEVLTLAFVFFPRDPESPENPWRFQATLSDLGPSFPNRTRLLLVPRTAEPDLSAAFSHFCAAMEEHMPGLRGIGILTCSLGARLPSYLGNIL